MTATDTPPTPDPTLRDRIRDVIAATLHGQEALACTRAWSAWSVGTMREDDFVSLADQDEAVDELADDVMAELQAHQQQDASTADELHPTEPRHWLVIRELDTDPVIEHSGCPSKVTIYSPGEAGPAYRSPVSVAVTEHLCHVGAWLATGGFDVIEPNVYTIPLGRYEIEAWTDRWPSTPDNAEDWDGGIRVLDPIEPPSPYRSDLYCDHDGGSAADCTACQDPVDDGPDWPIPGGAPEETK